MPQIEQTVTMHKVVTFTYVIQDGQDEEILEQSGLPMSYIHGVDGKMYPSAERSMEGAKIGDVIAVSLSPEEGFGYPDPELMHIEKVEDVPDEYCRIGAEAMFESEEGETISMKVTKIANGEVTLDANHPFAGKTVVFRMTIVGIRDATSEEVGTGEVIDMQGPLTMQ